jgi:hypothetical protein
VKALRALRQRLLEPSTWAGLSAAVIAVSPGPPLTYVAIGFGAAAVLLKERGSEQRS